MREIVKELLEREKEYHLCEKNIDGFQFWQYERFYIDKCLRKSDDMLTDHKSGSKLKLLKYYFTKSDKVKKGKQTDVCFVSHPRRKLRGEKYECIYTDEIAKRFPNSVTLENFYAREHMEPIQSANVIYLDRIIIEAEMYEQLTSFFARRKRRKIAQRVCCALEVPFKGLVNRQQLERVGKQTAGDYFRYRCYYKRFEKLLSRINPQILVEVVGYGPKCMIFNEICKKRGILTIELQHGWLGKEHIAYNYAAEERIKQFPDKLYLFGDYYKVNAKFPIPKDQIISVGFPYYERELREHQRCSKQDMRYTVLFLSQTMYARQLSKLAIDLCEQTDKNEFRILYKLHPSEYKTWEEIHPMLKESSVEIIGENDMTLYDCFAISDAQVGIRSTTIYEGLGFHLQTFIFNRDFQDYLEDLVELGIADLVADASEIVSKVRKHNHTSYDVNLFWKENALYNLEHALTTELKNRCDDN